MLIPPTMIYFIPTALVILLIPGPAVIYITTRSLREGRRAGLASVAGIQLGDLALALLATFGLSAILLTSAIAFDIVKFMGAGYLVYLGVRAILSHPEKTDIGTGSAQISSGKNATKFSKVLTNGFFVELLNPRSALFLYAFLPQFVSPSAGAATEQILLFGIAFVLMGICIGSFYALLGSTLRRSLSRVSEFTKRSNYLIGATYIALGLAAAITAGPK